MLTWTVYLWWTSCEMSACHFDVWSFVLKMPMTVPLTSNRWDSQSLWVCLPGYNPQFGSIKILSFLPNLIVDEFSSTPPTFHEVMCISLWQWMAWLWRESLLIYLRPDKLQIPKYPFPPLDGAHTVLSKVWLRCNFCSLLNQGWQSNIHFETAWFQVTSFTRSRGKNVCIDI